MTAGTRVRAAVAALAVLGLASACGVDASPSASPGASAASARPSPTASGPGTRAPATSDDGVVTPDAPAATSVPVRLEIPAIGVATDLDRLRLAADGVLVPPTGFVRAGWLASGPAPGDPGPAVLAGHVDSRRGPAVFFRLRELSPGDTVTVVRADGSRARFRVESVDRYPKGRFPTASVYGPTPDRALRLVTCGGTFDAARRSYRDNIVVYAVAV